MGMNAQEKRFFDEIVRRLANRIRALESIQEGNGFVPYLFPALYGSGNSYRVVHGKHLCWRIAAGQSGYIELTMPRKVVNLEEAILIYIPNGTGTWDYTINSEGAYCEEDSDTHSDSITDDGEPAVDDRLQCLDISGVLTPYEVGDVVGVPVTCDALDTTTSIDIIGIRLR